MTDLDYIDEETDEYLAWQKDLSDRLRKAAEYLGDDIFEEEEELAPAEWREKYAPKLPTELVDVRVKCPAPSTVPPFEDLSDCTSPGINRYNFHADRKS